MRRYRIDFAPDAWTCVGSLSSEDFRALQRALSDVADQAANAKNTVASVNGMLFAGSVAAEYAVDGATETVTLLRLDKA